MFDLPRIARGAHESAETTYLMILLYDPIITDLPLPNPISYGLFHASWLTVSFPAKHMPFHYTLPGLANPKIRFLEARAAPLTLTVARSSPHYIG